MIHLYLRAKPLASIGMTWHNAPIFRLAKKKGISYNNYYKYVRKNNLARQIVSEYGKLDRAGVEKDNLG